LEAYHHLVETGELGERQQQVFKGFTKLQRATNLEVSRELKLPINQVTPRTNELVKMGLLEEKDKRKCKISGRKAIEWGLKKGDTNEETNVQ